MLRTVRKKIASSISKVEEVEDFNYGSWLRAPSSEKLDIGSITSRLRDTSNITYDVEKPITTQLRFNLNSSEVLPELKAFFFSKIRSNAVFFMMHTVGIYGVNLEEIEPKPLGYTAKNFQFIIPSAPIRVCRVKFNLADPVEYESILAVPEVFNYLSEMVPEIYDVGLLNFDEFKQKVHKIEISDIDLHSLAQSKIKKVSFDELKKPRKILKIKVPAIGKFKTSVSEVNLSSFDQPEIFTTASIAFRNISYWSENPEILKGGQYIYYDANDEQLNQEQKKVKELKDPKAINDLLKQVLKNIKKVDWDNRRDLHIKLLPYEETGAKFLVENDFALLQDEFGLDKQREVIAAIKFLFGNRIIKSGLIVCPHGNFGNVQLSEECNIEIGWLDRLKKYCPELPAQLIQGENDSRADQWNKSALLYIVDYETLLNDYHLKILENKKLKQIDCLVFDESQLLIRKREKSKEFLKSVKPKILWATSSLTTDRLQVDLNEMLNKELNIEKVKIRKKETIVKQAPRIIWHEEWITPDEDQKKEFKESLVECQKDLRRVLESGNPFRFQANIFTLLHRLKQVSNFAPGNTTSPKTNLLLDQVLTIKENGKKVIILSQYDRLGTKKIEKLFEQNKINYLLLPGGLSADEMRKSITLFNTKPEIVALISDVKISRLNFKNVNVPYLIRFDQWWNPISTWELEDIFISDENGSTNNGSISIYNYYLLESIDQQIKELLHAKGLLSKNLYELMQPKVFDELVTIDEWLRIFKMPASEEPKDNITPENVLKLINKSTLNFFRTILSKLFFKIGYTNVDIFDLPNSSSFNIAGEAKRNDRNFDLFVRVYLEGNVSKKVVEEIVMESASSENSRVFIITKGKFEEGSEKVLKENVTLLDGLTLSKYLIDLGLVNSRTTDPMANLKI